MQHSKPASRFAEHNIVHVIGFLSHTSTGEVVHVERGLSDFGREEGIYVTVHFDDGETTEFAENELRLATDQELSVYLQGHDAEFVRKVLLQQPFSTGNRVTINEPGHPMHNLPGIVGSPYSDSSVYNVRLEDSSINSWFNTTQLKHRLSVKKEGANMYVIEIKDEEGKVIERIEMPTSGPNGYSMTTIEREVTEHLYDLIEGYTLSITLEA